MDIDYLVPADLPGDRYLADAWLVAGLRRRAQYLIPENTEGFCRAAGGEKPPKSEGGMERAI